MSINEHHVTAFKPPAPGTLSRLWWPLVLLIFLGPLQGCMLGVAWVALVGTDQAMLGSGEVEMHPFENSWVALPEDRGTFQSMNRIAVSPFLGQGSLLAPDSPSTNRSEQLLMLSPAQLRSLSRQDRPIMPALNEQDEARVARSIGEQYGVDCVLFGRVVDEPNEDPKSRHRLRHHKRLYIHMLGSDGALLWKDELPFIVVVGRDLPSDDQVWSALMGHVMNRAEHLDLTRQAMAPSAG